MNSQNRDSHRTLFDYMKSKALSYEAEISDQLIQYRKNQSYYSSRGFSLSEMDELIRSIHNSHVSYLGDFHTHDQNSRNLVRIIKTFLKNKSNFAIGLEMVQETHQSFLDAYLKGFLTELEFLESINYSESWRFPWNHYQILFEYARENEIPVIALNSAGDLEKRDTRASERIINYVNEHPSRPMLVLFGELHINANKLPRKVKELSKNMKIRQTIIHQNLDDPYWKLIESGKSIQESKIVKFNEHEFCLFSSPPWMKYESMCYWYENLLGDPDFDIHEYIIEKGLKLFTDNTYENFVLIVEQVREFLNFKKSDFLEDINIYDHSRIEYVGEKINSLKSNRLKKLYEHKLEHNKSFHLLGTNILYCSNYSLNRLARLAGSFITQLQMTDIEVDFDKLKVEDFFASLVCDSMYAYLSAKSLNPFLKCDMYLDIELMGRKEADPKLKNIYESTLDFLKDTKKFKSKIEKLDIDVLVEVSLISGEIFGDVLFTNTNKQKDSKYPYFSNMKENMDYASFVKFVEKHILKNNLYKMRRKRFF